MGLEKAIKSGKEHRKQWSGKDYCKSVDDRCRNHGGERHKRQCEWCLGNRLHRNKKNELKGKDSYG